MVCEQCGAVAASGDQFCGVCGHRLGDPSTGQQAPRRRVTFSEAVTSGFTNYVNFEGRATRAEYWYWVLFGALLSVPASIVDSMLDTSLVSLLVSLALFLPGLAVTVRRLHDVSKSGWNYLWVLTIIGIVYVLYLLIQPSTPGRNAYGDA